MRQLTVTIPDDFYKTFIAFFKHMPDVVIDEKETIEVPEWQQKLVLERMENAKSEDFLDWDEVKKELDKKWL